MHDIAAPRARRLAVPALLASSALALGLAGCATPADGASSAGEGLRIVATTTQVADFTREIAGDEAQVTSLIQPNQSSHSFDPTAADLQALGSADVLVINGAGLEEWLDDAIEASGFAGTTVDASAEVVVREFAEGEDAHADEHAGETAEEHAAHSEEEAADEHAGETAEEHAAHSEEETRSEEETHADEAAAEGEEHSHEGEDPHIWTSATNAAAMVDGIATGLAEAAPESAEAFEANAAAYTERLDALDAWIVESMELVPAEQRQLVTNHEAFGYFVEAYGLEYVGAVIPSFDDNAEVSAADIDGLVDAIEQSGASAVFSETSLSPAAAETIASEAGVEVYSGEDGLYGDSLGPDGSDGATYIGAMVHNVQVLLAAWGADAPEPPAAVAD
ncbi:metal ABC transporter substrate-binding protein [Microcella daejeonensis]|uniref:Metal ABC transporter substrate-binding protein n=1 Tax=Microcella daejeonensis TaxID=2994971 RepID=A0A9E8MMK8_9MICO|nr:metal ABC transporter substrate-binding protein [Microcella daejeonensis]WAB82287.1 metal ABC transporter substrate-binding protein [Microcella daejeonensis]